MKKIILSIQNAQELASIKNGSCLSDVLTHRDQKLTWQCKHNHIWEATYHSIKYRKSWCPSCANVPHLNINYAKKIAIDKNGECLSDIYINARTNLQWKCKCGYVWWANLDNIKNKNKWCPKCAKRPAIFFEEVKEFVEKNNGKLLSKSYKNASSLLELHCNVCGNVWFSNYNNLKSKGSWCPCCGFFKSQKFLFDIIKIIFSEFECFYRHKKFDWLKTNNKHGKQELDIFVKDSNSDFSLAIEYDGQQHYQPVEFFGGEKTFNVLKKLDKLKEEKIKQHLNDIKYFIRIPYWEKLTEENIKKILKEKGILL